MPDKALKEHIRALGGPDKWTDEERFADDQPTPEAHPDNAPTDVAGLVERLAQILFDIETAEQYAGSGSEPISWSDWQDYVACHPSLAGSLIRHRAQAAKIVERLSSTTAPAMDREAAIGEVEKLLDQTQPIDLRFQQAETIVDAIIALTQIPAPPTSQQSEDEA